jgi:hypothetical protein
MKGTVNCIWIEKHKIILFSKFKKNQKKDIENALIDYQYILFSFFIFTFPKKINLKNFNFFHFLYYINILLLLFK